MEVAIIHKKVLCSTCFDVLKRTEKRIQDNPHKPEEEPSDQSTSSPPEQK